MASRAYASKPGKEPARTSGPGTQGSTAWAGRSVGVLWVQAKLEVGPVDDAFEREADAVADRIMRMPAPPQDGGDGVGGAIAVTHTGGAGAQDGQREPLRRACEECEGEREKERDERLQRDAEPGAPPDVGSGFEMQLGELRRRGGEPLPGDTRQFMESRFGHSFGDVRVHAGGTAAELAKGVRAKAFTVGSDVVFGRGEYRPHTGAGQRLLAHELVHTLQQGANDPREGDVPRPMSISRSHDAGEREADTIANRVLSGQAGQPTFAPRHRNLAGLLQRDQAPNRASQLEPCTETAKLQAAVISARQFADNAVRGLEALLSRWGQPPANITEQAANKALENAFNIESNKSLWVDQLGMDVQAVQVQDSRDQAATRMILENFRRIAGDLLNYTNPPPCSMRMISGQPCFGCAAAEYSRCAKGYVAFVPKMFLGKPSSSILFCPAFFALGPERAGKVLLHESTHLNASASDDIGPVLYYGCPVIPIDPGDHLPLPGPGLVEPMEFIRIADSYSCFVETQRTAIGDLRRAERAEQEDRRIVNEAI